VGSGDTLEWEVTMLTEGVVPRYYQLKTIIREQISTGAWKPGGLIPSERELSERYGVSRMTVRQSLTELVNEGFLYRRQGRGTFVAWPKITQHLTSLTGFSEDMRARGQRPGARILAAEMWPADEDVAVRLQIAPGQRVVRLRRLRLADGEPLAIEESALTFFGCEALLAEDLEGGSLYEVLDRRFGLPIVEAEQEIEAGLAGPEDARLLGVAPGSPVLLLRRTTYTERGRPLEYAESVYRGDKYRFHARMGRGGA
jgi:GntR family transcriptional regulator